MLPEHRTGPVINQLDSPTYILVSRFHVSEKTNHFNGLVIEASKPWHMCAT
jgi:hypothetical protein